MSKQITSWVVAVQVVVQYVALSMILGLALAMAGWTGAAALGLVPWLDLPGTEQAGRAVPTGVALQLALTMLLVGLCFFVPTNARIMRLENSHRRFAVSMQDVARAYHAVHAADRNGLFRMKSEYDSVRERLLHLREHPDLADLEPEILELAAQMGHESRDLAAIYSDEKVARARAFLSQREEEAAQFQERVQLAHATCHELRRWLDKVQIDESVARSQVARLREDLAEILPAIGLSLDPEHDTQQDAQPVPPSIRIAAE